MACALPWPLAECTCRGASSPKPLPCSTPSRAPWTSTPPARPEGPAAGCAADVPRKRHRQKQARRQEGRPRSLGRLSSARSTHQGRQQPPRRETRARPATAPGQYWTTARRRPLRAKVSPRLAPPRYRRNGTRTAGRQGRRTARLPPPAQRVGIRRPTGPPTSLGRRGRQPVEAHHRPRGQPLDHAGQRLEVRGLPPAPGGLGAPPPHPRRRGRGQDWPRMPPPRTRPQLREQEAASGPTGEPGRPRPPPSRRGRGPVWAQSRQEPGRRPPDPHHRRATALRPRPEGSPTKRGDGRPQALRASA